MAPWCFRHQVLVKTGISDLPALDGPFIHPKAAQRPKLLFVTAENGGVKLDHRAAV